MSMLSLLFDQDNKRTCLRHLQHKYLYLFIIYYSNRVQNRVRELFVMIIVVNWHYFIFTESALELLFDTI